MAASTLEKSLADELDVDNQDEERNKIMARIEGDFKAHGAFHVTRAQQRTIVLVGRTRVGKSTIKSMLVNPTDIANELTLKSETREAAFESFHVAESNLILNIIDTPGLFERGTDKLTVRDNETIMKTIETCVNREITKLHVICFCAAVTVGINKEDIQALELLLKSIGEGISANSCLIVTQCESKNEQQRRTLKEEIPKDLDFQRIAPFFKLGVFFSGALSRDDYNNASNSLIRQFVTVSNYRKELLKIFTSDIEPFPIDATLISDIRRARDDASAKGRELQTTKVELNVKMAELEMKEAELEKIRNLVDEQVNTIEQMKKSQLNNKHEAEQLHEKIQAAQRLQRNADTERQQMKVRLDEIRRQEEIKVLEEQRRLAEATNTQCNIS